MRVPKDHKASVTRTPGSRRAPTGRSRRRHGAPVVLLAISAAVLSPILPTLLLPPALLAPTSTTGIPGLVAAARAAGEDDDNQLLASVSGPVFETTVVGVHDATDDVLAGADLLVVGGPTHVHGMSSHRSREGAKEIAAKDDDLELEPDAEGPGLRELGSGHQVRCFYAEEIDPATWQPPAGLVPDLPPPSDAEPEPILEIDGLRTYYEQASRSVLSLVGLGKEHSRKGGDEAFKHVEEEADVSPLSSEGT